MTGNTDDMNTIVQMGLAMEELQQQLSDCTLAREAETINCRSFMKRAERWEERATAAEAALAEAVKEWDKLAAQLAVWSKSAPTLLDEAKISQQVRARAQALLNVVRAAEAFHTYLTRTKVKYRDGTNLNLKATPPFERFDADINALKDSTKETRHD